MNLQRKTGSYYTPKFLADFIVKWIAKQSTEKFVNILEPSCGDGVFIDALLEFYSERSKEIQFDLVEINEEVVKNLTQKFLEQKNISIQNEDFLDFQLTNHQKYSLVIGNPPYIKRSLLTDKQALLSKKIFESYQSLTNSNLKNIWSSFLVRAINFLDDNGIIAFVLPAELLQVDYAAQLRKLLVSEFSRIEIFTFNELLFKECKGQDTIILIAYKNSKKSGLFFSNIDKLDNLNYFENIVFTEHDINEKKWSSHSLNIVELQLINKLIKQCQTVGDICDSKPGVVTAANNFFILNKCDVLKYNLNKYTKPIVQKGSLIKSNFTFDDNDFNELISSSTPCFFIDLNDEDVFSDRDISPYLEWGVEQELHYRYKMLGRSHWFQVPHTAEPTPLFFFKRCHNFPKLVCNSANVIATDSAYLVKPKANYDANSILFSFYNSFTLACAELMGRYYGGGVLELTPNEFKKLPLPYLKISKRDFNKYIKINNRLDDIREVCLSVNDKILKTYFPEITNEEIDVIEKIRVKLVKRRLRL